MHLQARASLWLPQRPEAVFDYLTEPQSFPEVFHGYGPVPGMRWVALLDGATRLAEGVVRDVTGDDGSVLRERITLLLRPAHYRYTIIGGLAAPLGWLVRGAAVTWELSQAGGGTRIDWRYAWTLTAPLAAAPAWLIIRMFLQTAMRRCLEQIRRRLADQSQGVAKSV